MLKFKYNYQNNTLAYQIDFQVYAKQIKAFAKLTTSLFLSLDPSDIFTAQTITYYRKYLAKDCPVSFEFSEKDAVEKIGGKWIYNWKGDQRE